MILELLEVVSVLGDRGAEILCKFCYGDEELTGWLRPCKCSGTLKWVHKSCFDLWMKKAPTEQQDKCQTCRHLYDKHWVLKSYRDWSLPPIRLRGIALFEVVLDAYSTFKFFRGFLLWWRGQRNILFQILHLIFWRAFIATNRRLGYYRGLVYLALTAVFEIQIKDYDPDATRKPYSDSRPYSPDPEIFINPRPMILAHVPVNPNLPYPALPGLQ